MVTTTRRSGRENKRALRLITAVPVVVWILALGVPAEAACAAPAISVPRVVAKGERVRVSGRFFLVGCNDVSVNGATPAPEPADSGIRLLFRQGRMSWNLGFVDANSTGNFLTSIRVPSNAFIGSALVEAVGKNGTARESIRVAISPTALPNTGRPSGWHLLVISMTLLILGLSMQALGRRAGNRSAKGMNEILMSRVN